jgi:hypothetical protein
VVCESEILLDFEMGRGVMTDDASLYTTTTDEQTVAHVIPCIAVYIARGIFYMYCCLFSIVSYRNNTVYAVGDVLWKNIRRRFDADYDAISVVSFVILYRASYTLSIVYSLFLIVILIDIYDMCENV